MSCALGRGGGLHTVLGRSTVAFSSLCYEPKLIEEGFVVIDGFRRGGFGVLQGRVQVFVRKIDFRKERWPSISGGWGGGGGGGGGGGL